MSSSLSVSYFVLKSLWFILVYFGLFMAYFCGHSEHNTEAAFFPALIFKIIKLKNNWNTRTGKFERDIFLFLFTNIIQTIKQNEFFKSKLKLHDEKPSRETNVLFNLNGFSNYGSSNYRSFLGFTSKQFLWLGWFLKS